MLYLQQARIIVLKLKAYISCEKHFAEGTFVVVQKFCRNIDFFDFPLNSSRLNIWAVDLLNTGSDFDVFPVENLGCKTILLPFKDVYVAIPVVHTDHGKFQKKHIVLYKSTYVTSVLLICTYFIYWY